MMPAITGSAPKTLPLTQETDTALPLPSDEASRSSPGDPIAALQALLMDAMDAASGQTTLDLDGAAPAPSAAAEPAGPLQADPQALLMQLQLATATEPERAKGIEQVVTAYAGFPSPAHSGQSPAAKDTPHIAFPASRDHRPLAFRLIVPMVEAQTDAGTSPAPRADIIASLSAEIPAPGLVTAAQALLHHAGPLPKSEGPAIPQAPQLLQIPVPISHPEWQQALAERVVITATEHTTSAQLHLNPHELGPVEVSLKFDDDKLSLQFVAPHATTRDALESALPRLRELLAQQGLQLAQADVQQRGHPHAQQGHTSPGTSSSAEPAPAAAPNAARPSRSDGLDLYA